jgi:YVTN family beta-propeller protein
LVSPDGTQLPECLTVLGESLEVSLDTAIKRAYAYRVAELPQGTVTFLFTDIEGSTGLLKQLGDRYGEVLDEHRRLLRAAFAAHGGHEIDTQGDAFFVVFARAKHAIAAAVDGQRALAAYRWPEGVDARVRMGLHSGEPVVGEERYTGIGVHRAARIGDAGHGGQVLLSDATRALVEDDLPPGISLIELGRVHLKGIDRPERVCQLAADGLQTKFPPLRTEGRHRRAGRRLRLLIPALVLVLGATLAAALLLGRRGTTSAQASLVAADSVGVFQSGHGTPIAQVPVRARPSSVVAGGDSVWVANVDDNTVSRIDPKTNSAVQTIPVGNGPAGIAVGASFVWVANGLDGTVSKIDPQVNGGAVVDTFPAGNGPSGVAFGAGRLWVANASDRTVMEFVPGAHTPVRTIHVAAGADAIAFGHGSVWVASEAGNSVTRIDPGSGTLLSSINVGTGPSALAVGSGAVWVANSQDGTVSKVDPKSDAVRTAIAVGDRPNSVVAGGDGVWVSNESGTLSRIDPAQDKVVRTIKTGNRPEGVALTGGALYVAVRSSSLAHRGGTLTIANSFPDVGAGAWNPQTLTNDGLTAFRRVGGGAGAQLVPDLATSLPTPTDGGRTYTFQLRSGIRYSNGATVRPEDVRRTIERAIVNQNGPMGYGGFYLNGVVGAHACLKSPKRCDLAKGVVTNAEANTVTIHLAAPDPDLLYQLALPFAFVAPADTPLSEHVRPPATGPYMVAAFRPGSVFRLRRNPYFHEWSSAAQPSGYPDTIVWKTVANPQRAAASGEEVRAVEQGKADVAFDLGGLSPARLTALETQSASQLHSDPAAITQYFGLNTRVPPFDDVRIRRAVSYAIDRMASVRIAGGLEFAQPSCQVLPPNFNGYRRYCPFTINPNATGTYTGPNLPKARKLVAASHTTGERVTVWAFTRLAPLAAELVSTLNRLGYTARLHVVSSIPAYGAAVANSRRRIQAFTFGWSADYTAADGFIPGALSCSSFLPASPGNQNATEFCNHTIDAEIARARSLQTSDPAAASRLWSKIDHDITDQAPWVVARNPTNATLLSTRAHNYTYNPQWGVLLDQLWVR